MKTAIIGKGLIGGSLEKAAKRAGFEAEVFRGRGPLPDLSGFEIVFVAVPPSAVVPKVEAIAASGALRGGARVIDIAGVKTDICGALAKYACGEDWRFVGGHPMAGKEKTGYENSSETLFDGASMILVPPDPVRSGFAARDLPVLEKYFETLGFGRTVVTDPAHHDAMIAFTSQLCHLISSAYVREPLAASHSGYSAGSFRDMVRVGAPDPEVWTDLFFANSGSLLPVLDRYVARLGAFADALRSGDREAMLAALREGVAAKDAIDAERKF